MPNVWAGTTLDGVQCRLNSEPAGLVAHVGKGGKKISRRVARPSTSLFECVAAMERVLDRSQTPLPSPADLHAILCGLPLLWLEAGQRFESGEWDANVNSIAPTPRYPIPAPLLLTGVQWARLLKPAAGRRGGHRRCASQPRKPPPEISQLALCWKKSSAARGRSQRLSAQEASSWGRRAEKGCR